MRGSIVLFVLAAALVGAGGVLAGPPAGKGGNGAEKKAAAAAAGTSQRKPTTGPGCRPAVQVILKGTLASAPGEGAASLAVDVASGNAHARVWVGQAGVAVALTPTTAIRRRGAKTVASLLAGDRVLVQARACKADLAAATPPALVASRVIAQPGTAVAPVTAPEPVPVPAAL
jgi:hypothetical protein